MQRGQTPSTTKGNRSVEILTEEGLWALHEASVSSTQRSPTHSHRSYRLGIHGACAALTIALHAALVGSIFLGSPGRPRVLPLFDGASASAQNAQAGEFVSTMILLNDQSITDPEIQNDSAYDVLMKELNKAPPDDRVIAQLASISRPEISGSEDGNDVNAPPIETTGDDQGRAMLFGMYMGQIKARIARAWEYPATPVQTKFRCRVEILQSERGDIREVTLQQCDGDPAWQLSLVQAIQRASPLPAPPSKDVFTQTLKLSFDAASPAAVTTALIPKASQ